MPDEPTNAPAPEQPPAPPAETPEGDNQEEQGKSVEELVDELRKTRAEAKERRLANEQLSGKLTAYEREKLTEEERLKAEIETLKENESRTTLTAKKNALKLAAAKLNFKDPTVAVKMLADDVKQIELDDDGNATNAAPMLKALLKDYEFLAGPAGSVTDIGAGKGTTPTRTNDDMNARIRAATGR